MQVHISPSMSRITISTTNGFLDLMKVKGAARHLSYRSVFYTILILAFFLPFVFILTAVVTLEGANKCSSLECIGRRLGPRLLRRGGDASPRVAKQISELLLQASNEPLPEGLTVPESFDDLVADMKTNQYDAKTFALKIKAMVVHLARGHVHILWATELRSRPIEAGYKLLLILQHFLLTKLNLCPNRIWSPQFAIDIS